MAIQSDELSGTAEQQGDQYANNLPPRPDETDADPYADKAAVSKRIDFFLRKDRFTRWIFEREWFRNVLYYIGRHWIIYDNTNRRWRPKSLPVWFPQPYTNKFAEKANDIMAAYQQGRVPINYLPASSDPDAVATAEIAEEFREVFYEEAGIEDHEALLAGWVTLTGNGFIHSYFDYSEEYGTKFIQSQECQVCGTVSSPADVLNNDMTCPACNNPTGAFQPAVDQTGQPLGETVPKGRLVADVISPFEVRLDPTIPDLLLQRRFTRVRTYDVEFARMYWGGKEGPDGQTIDPKTIVADKESNIGQFYLDAISYITSSFGAGGGFIAGGGSAFKLPRVSAYEYYELPTDDFPQGLHAVRLGHTSDLVVVSEPLDTMYMAGEYKGQYFLPLVHFGQDRVPGRLWRKTRMDDLIPLQNFRNLVEAAMKITAQRTGNPIWLNPKGSGVANMTGEPGQWVDYNPVSVGGTQLAKPERVPADLSNVQGFTVLMNKIDDSMERVAGTFFVNSGEPPSGVTAASALSYLGEKSNQAIGPLRREWAKAWKRWEMQALEISRQHWDEERIIALAGDNRRWEIKKFMKADLQGAVVLKVDYEGLFKKSSASKRADIELLLQMGVIQAQNPETQWSILESFGETELMGSTDLDFRQATREFDDFSTLGIPPKVVPLVQNSPIHVLKHSDDAKTDRFKALPLPMQNQWIQHIHDHILDIQAQQAMNAPKQAPPSESINYKDLPPEGQEQMAQQAGIKLNPGNVVAMNVAKNAPKPAPGGVSKPGQTVGGPAGTKVPGPIRKGQNRAAQEIKPLGEKMVNG